MKRARFVEEYKKKMDEEAAELLRSKGRHRVGKGKAVANIESEDLEETPLSKAKRAVEREDEKRLSTLLHPPCTLCKMSNFNDPKRAGWCPGFECDGMVSLYQCKHCGHARQRHHTAGLYRHALRRRRA